MATSLLSNRTSHGTSHDNAIGIQTNSLSDAQRRQIVDLLKASARCVEGGACGPVVYQTMGALHQYTAICAALISPEVALGMKYPFQGEQPSAVVDSSNSLKQPEHVVEPSTTNKYAQSNIDNGTKKCKEEEEEREKERLKVEHQKKLQAEARQMELEAKRKAEELAKEKQAALVQQQENAMEQKKQQDERNRVEIIETKGATTDNPPAKQPAKHKPMTAAEKQKQRMEREIAARKRAEDERRRIEIEYEQQKKEKIEQRRRELEAKRKLAREEQKRKEQIQKQKFLEAEQRKEAMKAAAMKPVSQKTVKGVFNTKVSSSKNDEKGNLWYSLNKHMSAFETADEERKRKEAEKREEKKAEEEEEDPEVVRKRIAEQARQRQVQDEVGKRRMEVEAAGGAFYTHSSVSPTTSQHSQSASIPSVSSPGSAQHKPQGVPLPSVPSLHHPNSQSWNKLHQPPYPPQQTQTAPLQRPQAPVNPPNGSFPQKQAAMPASQPQTASPSAYRRSSTSSQPQAKAQQLPQPQPANSDFSESELKRNVLVQWGLVPPNMQVLKPVDELLCSIHGVFPPSFGVASHDYFSGWKAIDRSELVTNGILEEGKLKKSVRKVRFFLHPDKLPHDLTEDQGFLCKLLWDVINDAFEEYKRSKEDLDWM